IPTSQRDLQISQAFAREALILTVEAVKGDNLEWLDADLILATGGVLAHAPKYGQAALMLLDALQPRGVTSLVLDCTMLVAQLGAVATVAPIAAVQVNENDAVTHRLGTCVIPFGTLPENEVAVSVGIEYTGGRQVTVDVMSGSIEVIPLRSNEQALLSLFPAPTVDVGLGPGERARAAEEIDGGLVGLIIDARGRPLVLSGEGKERQKRLSQWMQAIGA
ncbi:MAG: glutamate mutase L, partial [Chloroflexota bacterium]|nr:glutamate mutase L [Chloroflexota bacterium]